ncbi:peptidoglycan-binding protein [Bradyrhizobium brasilense]|uniref:peptidoglycan-binding protein n=1 Tax=Bradyrhizobium brasilense TaxID=1419277 RepID=UPI001F2C0C9C|nr:peptidoglycan-binding protein [Bradyrhizobium brasilense]
MLDLHGISRAALDLIVAAEVTSQTFYDRHYRTVLEHPSDNSGPTGAIGYDFGTQTAARIRADWGGRVSDAMLKVLVGAASLRGDKAAAYCRKSRGMIDVPWDVALDVFANHDVPRYLAICRRLLPGFDVLSPDCKGVILSIGYNRDASGFNKPGTRWTEMRQIKACIASGELAKIPGLIRSMKRLWPNERGVCDRRRRRGGPIRARTDGRSSSRGGEAADDADAHRSGPGCLCPGPAARVGLFRCRTGRRRAVTAGPHEGMILAYRNEHGLLLTPAIDERLLAELAKPQAPRHVAETRARATVKDLRDQGSRTIALTDQAKRWAGKIFGGSTGLTGAGVLAWITDRATQVSAAKDAVGGLGLTPGAIQAIAIGIAALVVVAGVGVPFWFIANHLEQHRIADYRAGKNA